MTREREPIDEGNVSAALTVSLLSVVWTLATSAAAIVIGLGTDTAVLVAFGAIGIVDAAGSIALAYHFHHARRHDALSAELERLAHRVVLGGLFVVGCGATAGGLVRLARDQVGRTSSAGVVLAAVSLIALVALATRKLLVARRVGSAALRSDGHLSGVGAVQAAVTLAGTVSTRAFGWTSADAVATSALGCVAIALAVTSWRAEHERRVGSAPCKSIATPSRSTRRPRRSGP